MPRDLKVFYATCARVPGKKAHCSQIAQMCRAFVEIGLDLELLHPARSGHGDYKGASIEDWYGFSRPVPARRLACIDLISRVPSVMPRKFTSAAYSLMVESYNASLTRYLRRTKSEFHVYSRDPRVLRRVTKEFPSKRVFLELHMLRDRSGGVWEDRLFEAAHGIIVVTDKMKEMLQERGVPERKVLVEPNGVDNRAFPGTALQLESRERLGLDPGRKYVTFVGNFRALNVDRGLGTIIQAIPRVTELYPEVTFLFVGGPLEFAKPYIEDLQRTHVSKEHYMFRDRQPYNEIHHWLAASDVLVHPVPDHPIYTNITSPLKLFEYMTAERPIIASDLPSIREILVDEETALLFTPGDSGDLANAFIRTLSDRDLGRRIAKNAKAEVAERTWEARAGRIRDWLEAGTSGVGRRGAK